MMSLTEPWGKTSVYMWYMYDVNPVTGLGGKSCVNVVYVLQELEYWVRN